MSLNSKQKEAVEHTHGPMLVLAGAGTGKTTVLVEHVKHLIANGHCGSQNILATTFTVKATEEMRQRLAAQGIAVPEWIGTFHSLCVKIVRKHAHLMDIDPNFKMIEGEAQKQICKRLFGQQADEILEQINIWKNNCKKPEDVFRHHEHRGAYERYQAVLKEENALDFGDLILECCYLWAKFNNVLEEYQRQFTHICIDEFQDTNAAQFLWLRLLTAGIDNPHVFCVGDDDQAIYGWRGSDNQYILNFRQNYPTAKMVKLEENYRSTEKILQAALKIVEQNKSRLGKTLISTKGVGDDVQVRSFMDNYRESLWLVDNIMKEEGTVGVLVRTMWQATEAMKTLREKGLMDSSGVKALQIYLKFLHKPTPELFTQILQVPKKGFGSVAVSKFLAVCERRKNSDDLFASSELTYADMKEIALAVLTQTPQKLALETLFKQLDGWLAHTHDTPYLVNDIWKAFFKETVAPLHVLQLAMRYNILTDFLPHFKIPEISVMTIHSAKGLEFDSVYLLGWEENIFPHVRSVITNDIESERRLAYVAITRGRTMVYITHVMVRHSPRGFLRKGPSRFLDVI